MNPSVIIWFKNLLRFLRKLLPMELRPTQTDSAVPLSPNIGVFRVFNKNDFIQNQSWKRLESLLRSNSGGAFGIGGLRGSGKTWLISKSVEWARENHGVGLWFPTPSDYGAEPFLNALANNFASEVQRQFREGAPRWYSRFASKWVIYLTGGLMLFLFSSRFFPTQVFDQGFSCDPMFFCNFTFQGLQSVVQTMDTSRLYFNISVYLVWISLGILLTGAVIGLWVQEQAPVYLYARAVEFKRWLRYSETLRSNLASSIGITGIGQTANLGITRQSEKSLAERALTIASLVYEFRNFMQEIAEKVPGPIVIGIDELDKIHDPERAKQLLRDIKGIFEVNRINFLVSISKEAKRNLNLGSLQERDEFNSTFYTVIDLLPNDPTECANLLATRSPNSFDDLSRYAIGILGAGNFREVLRLADICLKAYSAENSLSSLPQSLSAIVSEEAQTIRNEVLDADLPEYVKVRVFTHLDENRFAVDQLSKVKNILPSNVDLIKVREGSKSISNDSVTTDKFIDLWSKFQIRVYIVQQLIIHSEIVTNKELATELQKTVITLSSSAAVAEDFLKSIISKVNSPKKSRPKSEL
jgi:hypothetical protein